MATYKNNDNVNKPDAEMRTLANFIATKNLQELNVCGGVALTRFLPIWGA